MGEQDGQGPQLATAFTAAVSARFSDSMTQIEHCVAQLSEHDLYWRPFEGHNSVCNIILHLCGNIRQWIISGVGEVPDTRDRPAEFADRRRVPPDDLLDRLRSTLDEVDEVLGRLTPEDLLASRRIQGFETSVLPAVLNTLTHFVGHVQEITYITRLRLEDDYAFRWAPTTREEGAPV